MRHWLWLLLIPVCCLIGCAGAPIPPAPTAAPLPAAEPLLFGVAGTIRRDIVYCTADGTPLHMDLYRPEAPRRDPAPVLLHMSQSEMDKALVRFQELRELLGRGYAIAAINVRQPPLVKFPHAVEDSKCAVRHLRANARAYRIDPDRIGAWGCSLGGYLAAMLAVTDASAGLEGDGGYAGQSSRVRAVAVEDVIANMDEYSSDDYSLQYLFGIKTRSDPVVARSSPVTYLSPDDAPFIIFASDSDSAFWIGQAQELEAGLESVRVPVERITVRNAPHCWETFGVPSAEQIAQSIGDFFDRNLN